MNLDIDLLEKELRKRTAYHYQWGRKQNNEWDRMTNFIYRSMNWEAVVEAMKASAEAYGLPKRELFNYAANRWFNFWSAVGVEQIFSQSPKVVPALNRKNRLVDFSIQGIDFDHKTSVFPKGFNQTLVYAKKHEEELLRWLYKNQSQGKRKHLQNRLFIVVYAENGQHYKLKAELGLMRRKIENYLDNFGSSDLKQIQVEEGKRAFSDIIWVECQR